MYWENWIPGVLNIDQMNELAEDHKIISPDKLICDNSSFDLHLSDECFEMTHGSVKPSENQTYSLILEDTKNRTEKRFPKGDSFILESRHTYVFKLREELNLMKLKCLYGQATARSTIGRLDVLARLIVDGMDRYDSFDPKGLENGNGKLYVEITPITFPVIVKKDISVIQLRLFKGKPEESEIRSEFLNKAVLLESNREDGTLSVDLSPVKSEISSKVATALCATKKENVNPIPLFGKKELDPSDYWTFETAKKNKNVFRLEITNDRFYILRSREKIALPNSVAVYCRAMDETFGEMRIHYAGFVHPYFGLDRTDGKTGTPLIFEVRGHDVNVSLGDDEPLAKLIFYRMSKDATDNTKKGYGDQNLNLSKVFKDW